MPFINPNITDQAGSSGFQTSDFHPQPDGENVPFDWHPQQYEDNVPSGFQSQPGADYHPSGFHAQTCQDYHPSGIQYQTGPDSHPYGSQSRFGESCVFTDAEMDLNKFIFNDADPIPPRHSIVVPSEYKEFFKSELDTRFNTFREQIGGIFEEQFTQLRGEFSEIGRGFGNNPARSDLEDYGVRILSLSSIYLQVLIFF